MSTAMKLSDTQLILRLNFLHVDNNNDGTWFIEVALPSGLVVDFVVYAQDKSQAIRIAIGHVVRTYLESEQKAAAE